MSSVVINARKKIQSEVNGSNNPYIKVVGEFLIELIEENINAAEAIMRDGKSIKGSLEKMKKVARSKAVGGCAVIDDVEGFKIVKDYYGIKDVGAREIKVVKTEKKVSMNEYKIEKQHGALELDLDDLL